MKNLDVKKMNKKRKKELEDEKRGLLDLKKCFVAQFENSDVAHDFYKAKKARKGIFYSIFTALGVCSTLYFISVAASFVLFTILGSFYICSLIGLTYKMHNLINYGPYGVTYSEVNKMIKTGEMDKLKKEHHIEIGVYEERARYHKQEEQYIKQINELQKEIAELKENKKTMKKEIIKTLIKEENQEQADNEKKLVWVEKDKTF
ncbi:MAG: hypothetical protein ACI4TI_00570 [Christensenellales bacterium]